MMSLGEYGSPSSGSEISDSDGEVEPASNDRTDSHQSEADQDTVVTTCKRQESSTVGDPLDYAQGDTSSSDEERSEDDGSPEEKALSVFLPLPDLDRQTATTICSSVFSNPFKEAEEAKLAILKRHVSEFTPVDKEPPPRTRNKHCKGGRGSNTRIIGETTPTDFHGLFNDDDSCVSEFAGCGKRKKRSGVSDTLMPPKKYLKSYKTVQAKERPWTIKTSSPKS